LNELVKVKEVINQLGEIHLDHVALACESLTAAMKIYQDLGFIFSDQIEEIVEQKVKVAFAQIDVSSKIELLEPTSDDSPVAKFLQQKGPGIHHLCFKVPDIIKKSQELKQKGYQLLYEHPKVGAHGCLVNFIHPKSAEGVLIELSQEKK